MFAFLISFFMAFLAQKLIHTISIYFNFVFGSFFEEDHLVNLIILGVNDVDQNLINDFFSDFDYQRTFPYGCMALISEKTEFLYAKLNEKAEAATSRYSGTGNFYNTCILCLWLRIIRRSNLGVQFMNFPSKIFLTILIMVTEQLY